MSDFIVVTMLEPVMIDNLLYKADKRYKLPVWIAQELSKIEHCYYTIKPAELCHT